MWLRGFEKQEILGIFNRLNHMLSRLCDRGELDISVTAAAAFLDGKQEDYARMIERLRTALGYGKRRRKSQLTFCEDVPESECIEKRDYNEIASNGNVRALNMVPECLIFLTEAGRWDRLFRFCLQSLGVHTGFRIF